MTLDEGLKLHIGDCVYKLNKTTYTMTKLIIEKMEIGVDFMIILAGNCEYNINDLFATENEAKNNISNILDEQIKTLDNKIKSLEEIKSKKIGIGIDVNKVNI